MIPIEFLKTLAKSHAEWNYLYIDLEQPITMEQGKCLKLKQIANGLWYNWNIGFFRQTKNGKLKLIKEIEK